VALGSKSSETKDRVSPKLCREGNWSDSRATCPGTRCGSCVRIQGEPSAWRRRRTRRGRCSTRSPPPPRAGAG